MNRHFTRRRVLLTGAIAGAAAVLSRHALAAPDNAVALDDPQAKSLGYVEDASTVDTAAWPRKQPDQHCANCMLYQGGDAEWGPCSIFPGKEVKATGWCNVWAAKA